MKKNAASAGNRTRAARGLQSFSLAGEHSTTEPPMLLDTSDSQVLSEYLG